MLIALLLPAAAQGADLAGAFYDARTDELVVDIVYRGTRDDHRFVVEWGECYRDEEPMGVAGRVVDLDGDDIAREDFRVRERFSAAAIPCRPARVTLRLGVVSNVSVLVPDR